MSALSNQAVLALMVERDELRAALKLAVARMEELATQPDWSEEEDAEYIQAREALAGGAK